MRKPPRLLAGLLPLLLPLPAAALVTGDIAFTTFNADRDAIAFVALTAIPGGQKIYFTDSPWNGLPIGGGGAFVAGEGDVTWTAPAGGVAAGKVVVLDHFDSSTSASPGSATGGTGLSDSAETVYAYVGSAVRQPTAFLTSITNKNDGAPESIANTGLTAGSTALFLLNSTDEAHYSGARDNQASFAAYKSQIANLAANWTMNVSGSWDAVLPDATVFTVVNGNAPVLTVNSSFATSFNVPADDAGYLSGVIGDPADPLATSGVAFTLADAQTPTGPFTISATSSNTGVVSNSNLIFSGSGNSRALRIVPTGVGTSEIDVVLTDSSLNSDHYLIHYAASAGSSTPLLSSYHTGISDGSTAVKVANTWYAGSDEDQVIRLYTPATSGPPIGSADMNASLNLAKEMDIEASFTADGLIYYLGSHGNDSDGNIEPTRHYSFCVDPASGTPTFVHSYNGMRAALIAWDNANGHGLGAKALGFQAGAADGITANDPAGFNIEGAALAANGSALLGFRSPLRAAPAVQNGRALIVPVTNFRGVVGSGSGAMSFGAPVFLNLGGRSIRSITEYEGVGFLILAGPVPDAGGFSFELFRWNGDPASAPLLLPTRVNDIAIESGGSPEALVSITNPLTAPVVDLLVDNSNTVYYGNGIQSKDLPANWKKFRSDRISIPAPYVVTTLANSGTGSLRQIMADAQAGALIRFSPQLAGQTTTLSAELPVTKRLSVSAADLTGGITLSGAGSSRIFNIGSGGDLTLDSLKLGGGSGSDGSAISSLGQLTALDCQIAGNGSSSTGTIFLGGGSASLTRCTISGNSGVQCGGIWQQGGVSSYWVNCTIAGNSGSSGNSVGGIALVSGSMELKHCTVAGNTGSGTGGGIRVQAAATLDLQRSIVAGNADAANPEDDIRNSGGTLVASGPNLIGNNAGVTAAFPAGPLVGTAAVPLSPKLSPLGNYGGKTTVMFPLPGSPVIEAAGAAIIASDQRSGVRPVGPLADLGAVEAVAISSLGLASTDGDTIPDLLEGPGSSYPQLSPVTNDSARDSDGDGATDEEEIAGMTDPLDANSRFHVTSFQPLVFNPGSTTIAVGFSSFPGLSYTAEVSADLDFSHARQLPLGVASGFVSQYNLEFMPAERFMRIRRNP